MNFNQRLFLPLRVRSLAPVGVGLALSLVASCATDLAPEPDIDVPDQLGGDVDDAFEQTPIDPAKNADLIVAAQAFIRPGSVVQTEPRLGVPTFLWARESQTGTARAAQARWLMSGAAARPEIAASRAAMSEVAPLYKLEDSDVANAVVANVHDTGDGAVVVKYRAQVDGIEIFREELNVIMNRQLEPIALSGYLTSAQTAGVRSNAAGFRRAESAGALSALRHLSALQIDGAALVAAGSRDGYDYFDLPRSAGVALAEPIRMKKVYFHTGDGLEPAHYVEVAAFTGPPIADTLTFDGLEVPTLEAAAYVVSASSGKLLFRKNLISDAGGIHAEANALPPGGFTYRVWADPETGIPYDTPAGNAVHPKLTVLPDGGQAPAVAMRDVTLPNFPFSRNDPWLPPGSTETVGNNVDAFLNLFSPDGYGPVAPPSDPALGDYRAQITAPGKFLHTNTPGVNGALSEGRQAAIQQLFYDINFMHDWYYNAGFDEASGNAQTDNFGRGGVGNDSIRAQAQDFSGFSNANMLTGADGGRPRMRMYVFPSPSNMIDIQAPAGIAGKINIGISMSGPQAYDHTGDIVIATFTAAPACNVTNVAALAGKIAMFDFDNTDGTGCSFSARNTRLTEQTTALGHLMQFTNLPPSNSTGNPNAVVNITGFVPTNTKSLSTISFNAGMAIKAQMTAGQTVRARVFRAPDRDGTLDNQIVFHEFFHYVSNRLVGNGVGLGTNHAGGMGEGWSDFSALLLTAREEDTENPTNTEFNGVYAMATWATSGLRFDGGLNHGYYFGIRRYPYSTDMTKNPLTFKHITNGNQLPAGVPVNGPTTGATNSAVHSTGEVWSTLLWEGYAGLLRDTLGDTPRLSFQQAQDRMKRYVIGGLKATPIFPTFMESRDAILSMALANDLADYVVLRRAFAKRGAGAKAVAPDRFGSDNAGTVEDFSVGPDVTIENVALTEEDGCDQDGVLDRGEFGRITVTLRNSGTTSLRTTRGTITTPSPDVWFPDGNALTFRSLAIGATATASVRIAYARNVSGIAPLDFNVEVTDPSLAAAQTKLATFRTNTDELPASSATDTAEATITPMTAVSSTAFRDLFPWKRVAVNALQHAWHIDSPGTSSDQYLISPSLTVGASGSVGVAFSHGWSFESSGADHFDGGVVEMSVNGGAFADIGGAAYNGTLLIYAGNTNPLQGRRAFVSASSGVVQTALTATAAAGSRVQFRFRAASDGGVGAAGWTIDNVVYSGVVETPFATVIADTATCNRVPLSADLRITVDDGVTTVAPGAVVTYTIRASNAHGSPTSAALIDKFPSDLTCAWSCAPTGGAQCNARGNGAIQQLVILPVGGVATFTATCLLSRTTTSTTLSNSAVLSMAVTEFDPNAGNNTATDVDAIRR